MRDEHGAVAVMVALLMVPLIGLAAISIDVAAMWAERAELQNGADAGALAVAQDCALGSCGAAARTAQDLASANDRTGAVGASVAAGADQVSVTTSSTSQHFFAPVLGIDSNTLSAQATARWDAVTGGTAELPLALSWCDFQAATGGGTPTGSTSATITWPGDPEPTSLSATDVVPLVEPAATCAGPRGGTVSAGYRWLSGARGCEAKSSISRGFSSTGDSSAPGGCGAADLAELQGRTVVLPVFGSSDGADLAGGYDVYGYAAFTITGYDFGGQYAWGSPCAGDDRCVQGSFTRLADLSGHFDPGSGAPQLGAAVVSLAQ